MTGEKRLPYPNARVRMLFSIAFAIIGFRLLPEKLVIYSRILVGWDIGIVSILILAYAVTLGLERRYVGILSLTTNLLSVLIHCND